MFREAKSLVGQGNSDGAAQAISAEHPEAPDFDGPMLRRLPRHIVVLGIISLLTATSSAMVYGLLPVFLVRVLGATVASVGLIEGIAEAMTSLAKIVSGFASDRMGRRKPLVLLGYAVSAINKVMFPLAGDVFTVLVARVIDRGGKGMRDAPRDAFLTDVTPTKVRGSGFGLRLAFYTTGFVIGPLAAITLMKLSGDNFQLVFWIAVIPAFMAIIVVLFGLKEPARKTFPAEPFRMPRRAELVQLAGPFWWAIAVASLLSLARFSHAFLVLKAHHVGIDAAFVPIMLVLMHLVYAVAAYPFGILADHMDRRLQLGIGAAILVGADIVLAVAQVGWLSIAGAALWGLQMAVTQGLLLASVGDAAPRELRGTAFGIYDLAVGVATFFASSAAGALWMAGGPELAFGFSGLIATAAMVLLLFQPAPRPVNKSS
jgi:MFS family permease